MDSTKTEMINDRESGIAQLRSTLPLCGYCHGGGYVSAGNGEAGICIEPNCSYWLALDLWNAGVRSAGVAADVAAETVMAAGCAPLNLVACSRCRTLFHDPADAGPSLCDACAEGCDSAPRDWKDVYK